MSMDTDVAALRELAHSWAVKRADLNQKLATEDLPTFDRRLLEVTCERFRVGEARVLRVVGKAGKPRFGGAVAGPLEKTVSMFQSHAALHAAAARRKKSDPDVEIEKALTYGWKSMAQSLEKEVSALSASI